MPQSNNNGLTAKIPPKASIIGVRGFAHFNLCQTGLKMDMLLFVNINA
jgi:hypothetical protein